MRLVLKVVWRECQAMVVQEDRVASLNGSIPDFLSSLIASLGVDSQEAQRMLAIRPFDGTLESARKLFWWLWMKMGNLIRFQHAYNAAARLITALDETLSTVIERMGIVGR